MGWAENRIQQYQRGASANWLERRMLEHANPVHFPLALAGSLGIAYGLWTHRRDWIVGSALLSLAGHMYCWTRDDGKDQQVMGATEVGRSHFSSSQTTRPIVGEGMVER
jgi:hypothetical protein